MAMVSFEIDDKFLTAIDKLLEKSRKYGSRSEFIKEAVRKNYKELDSEEWKKKFREEVEKMREKAYSRGYKGGFPTHEERDKWAKEYMKEKGIKLS